ncbi:RNA methyltransferase [Acuticoccus sp. M5D2P5]|uniref:RNA methyltransferase n=1 Tax=Acuticoccus kalidii TaxID=2910977 RepID=UPI001F341DB9|nr:RNA methyltransferase [Acuticoccus kalidii]MCF3936461.1 RNA methyltransferase [Acuticoccus kalidii]
MTDLSGEVAAVPPAIVLVAPQLGENIGTAARAMANFGVTDLRLVAPRDGWPNEKARSASSGAIHVIENARVFGTLDEAIADLSFVIATTRRPRDMTKRVEGPAEGLAELAATARTGAGTGILFGRERWGLENDEIARANIIVSFPVDPTFASLNIAQSVLLMSYEWRRVAHAAPTMPEPKNPPATREDVTALWEHLNRVLTPAGYFRPPDMAEKMARNLLLILSDAGWDRQQVRTLRGVLGHLERPRGEGDDREG